MPYQRREIDEELYRVKISYLFDNNLFGLSELVMDYFRTNGVINYTPRDISHLQCSNWQEYRHHFASLAIPNDVRFVSCKGLIWQYRDIPMTNWKQVPSLIKLKIVGSVRKPWLMKYWVNILVHNDCYFIPIEEIKDYSWYDHETSRIYLFFNSEFRQEEHEILSMKDISKI